MVRAFRGDAPPGRLAFRRHWSALGLLAVVSCSSSGAVHDATAAAQVRADQARSVAQQAGLAPPVQDFLARAAAGSAATYTVVYDQGGGQRTTVLARPPDRRIDVQGLSDRLDRVIVRSTATYDCQQVGGRWTCRKGDNAAPAGPFTPDAVTQTIGGLVQVSSAYDFAVSHRTIAGVDATCLSADRKASARPDASVGDHGAICIAPDGAILALEGATQPLKATSYKTSVSGGAFDLPAKLS
jgi:hypothetical protein